MSKDTKDPRKRQLDSILRAIKVAAKETGKPEYKVNLSDVLAADQGLTEWIVRRNGNLSSILKRYFPMQEKDLAVIEENKSVSAYIAKLERQLGAKQRFEQNIEEAIRENLNVLPVIKLVNHKKQKTKTKREIVLTLNDTHFGLVVDSKEVNGLNSYGWKEACRRTAMVLREAIDFKPHTREEVERVHLILNGDMIAGLIHGLNTKSLDLYVHQVNGALHILINVVAQLLQHFKEVKVTGISGNHEDAIHKREGSNRVTTEKFDNYINGVYFGLSAAFRNNERVEFNFPHTPYAFVTLLGGRALIVHGDTIFAKSLGNPGTSINVKSLSDEIRKFNAGEIALKREPVKLVLFGHTHTHAHFRTGDGVICYVVPSLSGTDGYAHGLGINTNLTGQLVFESTPKYIFGDSRLIEVSEADTNNDLDQLIPIFKQELAWKK